MPQASHTLKYFEYQNAFWQKIFSSDVHKMEMGCLPEHLPAFHCEQHLLIPAEQGLWAKGIRNRIFALMSQTVIWVHITDLINCLLFFVRHLWNTQDWVKPCSHIDWCFLKGQRRNVNSGPPGPHICWYRVIITDSKIRYSYAHINMVYLLKRST